MGLTRREAMSRGALLALARLLPGPARALASGTPMGATSVRLPLASAAFRRTGAWFTSPPVTAPRPFDVLGLRWRAPADVRLELRVHRRGRWSAWVRAPSISGHAPDGARPGRVTDAVPVGRAKRFQVRASQVPTGLRIEGVAVTRRLGAAWRARAAQQPAGAPAMITRAQWGAQAPREAPQYGEVRLAFVHHTVSPNDYTPDESAAIVLAIQHYHRNTLGWNDIGYNLLIDRFGQIFEGRAGGIDQAVIGAQAQGYNSFSTGIALIGTHTSAGASDEAFDALATLLSWKLSLHGVPPEGETEVVTTGGELNRYPAGTRVTLQRISGHRDGDATECPGQALFDQLPALRTRVATLAPSLGLTISPSTPRVDYLAPTLVSGRLINPDGSPGAGRTVEVQALGAGGWRALATAVTNSAGAWAATVTLPYTRWLRAVSGNDPGQPPLISARARLEVRSKITAALRPTHLLAGRPLVVSGRIEPRKRRQRLLLILERRAGPGRYRRIARLPALALDGRFSARLFPSRAGLYRVRVTVRSDRLNARTRSALLFARVKRG